MLPELMSRTALELALHDQRKRIAALERAPCALSRAECRVLVDYLDACLIAEGHQPSEIVAIRDRALAATRRVDRPDETEGW